MAGKPRSWNEIRRQAAEFAVSWRDTKSESAEKQTFWNEFFAIFGLQRRTVAVFEKKVANLSGATGFIDVFWPGEVIAEHKSAGKDLAMAEKQALDYLDGVDPAEHPRLVVTSDFTRFNVLDLETKERVEFPLEDLPKRVELFGRFAGYRRDATIKEEKVSIEATKVMARLHDELRKSGYKDHSLRVLLVRLLFLMFADDTGLLDQPRAFATFIEERTHEDGTDLGSQLTLLFEVLDTPTGERQTTLDESLAALPYVNGGVFTEHLRVPSFTKKMRAELIRASGFDWSAISPAIFGSMFMEVMTLEERHTLGGHYTTEKNILRVLQPLFLDELWEELDKCRTKKDYDSLHDRLAAINVLDPACGCGNFLVIAYRELRRIELQLVLRRTKLPGQLSVDVRLQSRIELKHFHGIEYEEFPARIAEVALYLMEHLSNLEAGKELGELHFDLPLRPGGNIVIGNALDLDWSTVVGSKDLTYIAGNPPFIAKKRRNADQVADMKRVFGDKKGTGELDYVAAWFKKAADYIDGTGIQCALVATNSLTQGEQVPILWRSLLDDGIRLDFCHRTFAWSSDIAGKAAVHVVVIGFSSSGLRAQKVIYDYDKPTGEPHTISATEINPYLIDAPSTLLPKATRKQVSVDAPPARFGSMPNDGGGLILTETDRAAFQAKDAVGAANYVREMISAKEMIAGKQRWCLWLEGASPSDIKKHPMIMYRLAQVQAYRNKSTREATKKLAATPGLFGEIRQPTKRYLCLPRHPSQNRRVVPMAFYPPDAIASDSTLTIEGVGDYEFGILNSAMFMAWLRTVGGRIKSDLRVSVENVLNTFPWPAATPGQKAAIEQAAKDVLTAQAKHAKSSLADLYDPLAMPQELAKAHDKLDRAVDKAYRSRAFASEVDRLSFIFEEYGRLTGQLPTTTTSASPTPASPKATAAKRRKPNARASTR